VEVLSDNLLVLMGQDVEANAVSKMSKEDGWRKALDRLSFYAAQDITNNLLPDDPNDPSDPSDPSDMIFFKGEALQWNWEKYGWQDVSGNYPDIPLALKAEWIRVEYQVEYQRR
jgi:hypothetical protein